MKNTNPITIIQQELQEAHQLLLSLMGDSKLLETISKMADVITQVIENGGKIITCGNGGCIAMRCILPKNLQGDIEMTVHLFLL